MMNISNYLQKTKDLLNMDLSTLKENIQTKEQNKKYFFEAIDMDETIFFNGYPDVKKAIINWELITEIKRREKELEAQGFTVIRIMWTCRSNNSIGAYLDDAVKLCQDIGFPMDYINENPLCPYSNNVGLIFQKSPKIFYHVLYDDRAFNYTVSYQDIVKKANKEFNERSGN